MTQILPISATFSKISNFFPKETSFPYGSFSHVQKNSDVSSSNLYKLPAEKCLQRAIYELNSLQFEPKEINYLKNMGVNVPYTSGTDAVKFIKDNGIKIVYGKTSEKGIHAQYNFADNVIIINSRYKGNTSLPVVLAISEAILHETGHAKDKDANSSVQEELDCLGMNAIAHRAFLRKYSDIFINSKEPIIKDGVEVYAELFFDPDPDKQKLVDRMKDKYGYLPPGDCDHPAGTIAKAVKF